MNCRPLRLRRRGACSNGNRPGRSRPRHGFSLIELLITTGIILVLVTMYWGGNSATRQKSRQAVCRQNLQKVYLGIEIFGNEHQGKYPDKPGARTAAEALDVLVPRYTADTSGFICP